MTWTTLEEAFFELWSGWEGQDWEAVERATVSAQTDESGQFALVAPPPNAGQLPSAVWITHPRGVPHLQLLEPFESSVQLGAIELASSPPMTVRVVDLFEAPVEGARVDQFQAVPWDWRSDEFDPQAARIFRRTLETSAAGEVFVPRLAGEMLLRANHDDLLSDVWIGTARERLTLALGASFQVSGTVSYPSDVEVDDEAMILYLAQIGGQRKVLGRESVAADGRWGPVTLALGTSEGFHFRLEGGHIEVGHHYIERPAAGSQVTVDFEARAGMEKWFLVKDEESNTLLESSISMRWERDGVSTTSSHDARAEDGYVWFGDLPSGVVLEATAHCPGYASRYTGTHLLPQEAASTSQVTLVRAGQLNGRVVVNQEPLEDFEVTWWPTNQPEGTHTTAFRAAQDGAFALDAVPLQKIALFATAPGLAPSDIARVAISADAQQSVVLEPRPLLHGKGRVVIAASGLPLPDAVVQPFRTDQDLALAPWGPPHPVRSDGTFELTGFAAEQTQVRFTAPGYSTRWVETRANPGSLVDFGTVALADLGEFRVQLVWEGEFDPTAISFSATGAEQLAFRDFDRTGLLTYSGVSSGVYKILLLPDEGPELRLTAICEPGEDWLFRIPMGGPRSLRVEVVPKPGGSMEDRWIVSATLPSIDGKDIRQSVLLDEDRVATFTGILPGPFSVHAFSSSDQGVSQGGMFRENDRELTVRLHLGRSSQRIRLLDGRGDPLAGAWIGILDPSNPADGQGGETDATGECTMTLNPGRYLAAISHPSEGRRYDVPVEVTGSGDEVIELLLDAELHVEVQLFDGTQPQAGLQCRLFDLAGNNSVPEVTSDGQGLARWDKYAEGSYTIQVRHTDYWPAQAEVPARADELSTPIQVRRLGDLELSARSLTTGLVRGLAIELVSDEFEQSVGTWLSEGRVTGSDPELVTGSDGLLKLSGLPHGSYTWRATAPNGELAGGTAAVPPGELGHVVIALP